MATCYDNLLLCADSYKVSHHLQYPPKTERVYSYFESRGGKFSETVFFGLQYLIKKWLVGQVVTEEKIQQAKELWKLHFGNGSIFNEEGWRYILKKHGGRLPLLIKAVPEGTVVPTRNVLFTVENTDPNCAWLSNWVEVVVKCLELLGEAFGTLTNSKGYKLLPPYLRLIQGDGISLDSLENILARMKEAKWSADNVTFGSGGSLLQKLNRDTQKCAFKCSFITVDGVDRDVFKDPITDPGKASKKGRLTLEKDDKGNFVTRQQNKGDPAKDLLQVVFKDGELVTETTFAQVRERADL
ncbi:nicotinamide phosphoribosyltransferase [Salpingoeca rosetta]|uniref:Nicotinamide phosphoribosyltransferase n=1 Tax=Salpingoeca rosetta (strain ATCC 50818 / BSB-021) TaxID=946362 RepID=F2UBP2_SALR5|nr:nicotinamide phosphoribosyltransferase [Salpingoeca rosetta]EGD73908.1 nicotinamide phosphoribosyltransferase [Salpingoeca rosetta]|eukprot:XP_004993471.1 nicotinamide phosphoribosyltransferase [Salpingoeca rosetta]